MFLYTSGQMMITVIVFFSHIKTIVLIYHGILELISG